MKAPIGFALLIVLATIPLAVDGAVPQPARLDSCAACHGANGVSVAGGIPNLAGQKANYLGAQLSAYKEGEREHAIMGAIAAQLSDVEIERLAAYFSAQPGAPNGDAQSAAPSGVAMGKFSIPDDYQDSFTVYQTIDYPPPRNQVRFHYVNETALQAARAGEPLPDGSFLLRVTFPAELGEDGDPITGPDGHFVAAGEPVGFTAMAREAGWADPIPELLRNENWNYGSFRSDGTPNTGSQANCLGCHLGQADTSYLFTHEELAEAARAAN